jgi:hypothetical protein
MFDGSYAGPSVFRRLLNFLSSALPPILEE